MFAAKHFDPQLGIDFHSYLAPPGVWPTVHIGMVFDPFDYLPTINVSPDNPVLKALGAANDVLQDGLSLIGESTRPPEIPPPPGAPAETEMPESVPIPLGATVEVGGVKRANAGTGGFDFHILIGAPMPVIKAPMGPQFDDELFMGSRIVLADGDPFSRITMPVLACNVVGMIPPFRPKKLAKKVHLSLLLPTTFNVALPINVLVGGPPTISWAAMVTRSFLKALGKGFRVAARRLFKNMPPGFLKCKVLRAEPVDIRDGSVSVEHEDFEIPGRLPLTWARQYSSVGVERIGVCGHGWETPADLQLELTADGSVAFSGPGQVALFPQLPALDAGDGGYVLDLIDGARLSRDATQWVVRTKDGLSYGFAHGLAPRVAAPPQPQVLPIERIADACGNHWRFERRDGVLARIVESGVDDLAGRVLEVQATRRGLIEAITLIDPATGARHLQVSYQYAQDDLTAALDPLGAPRSFAYEEHRLVRHTDRMGLSFHYAYDLQWRAVHAWGDGGLHDYRFAYDDVLRQTEVTDSLGHTSIVKLDENHLPLCEIDPLGGVTVFEYDDAGRTVAVTDAEGLRTRFDHDERGNVLSITQADGSVVRSEYDGQDQVQALVDPGGGRWTRACDARGLPVSQTDALGAVTRFEHDAYGQVVRHVNARGAVTLLQYDRHGQLAAITDPLGRVTRFAYDVLGYLREQGDALGRTTRYHHDAKGRLLRIEQPDGTQIACEYDAEDRLLGYMDEVGRQTRLAYAGTGRIARRVEADGGTSQYHYDTEEQLVALTNARGERYEMRHDALGRIVEEVDYWGQSRHFHYDATERLTATVDALGQRIAIATDRLGRITRKTFPDALRPGQQVQEHFVYDARGQMIELRSDASHVRRRFDAAGQLTEELQNGFRIANVYDETGNRVLRETSAGNRLAWRFDLLDQVSSIAINDEAPIAITRDALGRPLREQLSPTLERRFAYDARNRITAQAVFRDTAPLFDTRYDYDAAGHLIARRDSGQGMDAYRYDVLGRLLEHVDPRGQVERFLHDPAGDRLQTHIRQTRLLRRVGDEEEPEPTLWTREGSFEGRHYVFDRAGDLIHQRRDESQASAEDLELLWDAEHRLVRSRRDGAVTTYGYDPLGRRAYKRNPTHTTWFFWEGDVLLGELRQPNDSPWVALSSEGLPLEPRKRQARLMALHGQVREYVYDGSFVPLAMIDRTPAGPQAPAAPAVLLMPPPVAGRVFHFQVDPNGCPTRLTDTSGETVWSAGHAAWGGIAVQHVNGIVNSIRFQGQYFDEETGLHYNRYRYYDPHTGTFVSKDPIGLAGGLNLYEYASNAFQWIDPWGLKKRKSSGIDKKTGISRMPKWLPTKQLWQRQHIVPFSVWRDAMPRLSQLGLTMTDVHGAHNMMMMPMFSWARSAQYPDMGLHRSFHPLHQAYNQQVREELAALLDSLQGLSAAEARAAFREFQFDLRRRTRTGELTCAS